MYFSNQQGSPDPVIVNNGDNTYTIVMYQDTELLLEVTDTARYTDTYGDGTVYNCGYGIGVVNEEDVWDVISCYEGINTYDRKDLTDISKVYDDINCPLSWLQVRGKSVGTVSAIIGYQESKPLGVDYIKDCTVTLNITVLPAQPGAQTPVYNDSQLSYIRECEIWKDYKYDPNGITYGYHY
jgi:hypothetical protein